jgi:hypothetical protein
MWQDISNRRYVQVIAFHIIWPQLSFTCFDAKIQRPFVNGVAFFSGSVPEYCMNLMK